MVQIAIYEHAFLDHYRFYPIEYALGNQIK